MTLSLISELSLQSSQHIDIRSEIREFLTSIPYPIKSREDLITMLSIYDSANEAGTYNEGVLGYNPTIFPSNVTSTSRGVMNLFSIAIKAAPFHVPEGDDFV